MENDLVKKLFFEIKGLVNEVNYKMNSTFKNNTIILNLELKCNMQ